MYLQYFVLYDYRNKIKNDSFLFHLKSVYIESITNVLCPILLGDNTAIFYTSALVQFSFHITVQQLSWERVHMVSSFPACVCSQEMTPQKKRHSSSVDSHNNMFLLWDRHTRIEQAEWMNVSSPNSLFLRGCCGGLPVLVNHRKQR